MTSHGSSYSLIHEIADEFFLKLCSVVTAEGVGLHVSAFPQHGI